jgi:prepilin-type processing-associated H-X9-DG protein
MRTTLSRLNQRSVIDFLKRGNGIASGDTAFTSTDLIAVIAIICALTMFLLAPALAQSTGRAMRVSCVDNMKRLSTGVAEYAGDNNDAIVQNEIVTNSTDAEAKSNWANGRLDFNPNNPDNTNEALLAMSPLCQLGMVSPKNFHCPSDESVVTNGKSLFSRVRSYAMNAYVGGRSTEYTDYFRGCRKVSDANPRTWVLIDQEERSIDDGSFEVDMDGFQKGDDAKTQFKDFPSARHSNGATVTFIDGSVESHPWSDPRTDVRGHSLSEEKISPKNKDIVWLQKCSVQTGYDTVRLGVHIEPREAAAGKRVEWSAPIMGQWLGWSPQYTSVGYGVTRVKVSSGDKVLVQEDFSTKDDPTDITIQLPKE